MSVFIGIGREGHEPNSPEYRRIEIESLDSDICFPMALSNWGIMEEAYLFDRPFGGSPIRKIRLTGERVFGSSRGGDIVQFPAGTLELRLIEDKESE